MDAILKNYSVLEETMIEINKHQNDDNGRAAGGIAALMDKFQTLNLGTQTLACYL